jgi:hypothetical protein
MASEAIVRVQGAKELRAGLKRAGNEVTDFKPVHLAVATLVAGAAHTVAPRGESLRTLRSIRPGATKRAAIVRVGRASVPYPVVDHYGNRNRNIKPNPWLVDIAHAEESTFIPMYERFVSTLVDKI